MADSGCVRGPGRSDEGRASVGQRVPQLLRNERHERVCQGQELRQSIHQHLRHRELPQEISTAGRDLISSGLCIDQKKLPEGSLKPKSL